MSEIVTSIMALLNNEFGELSMRFEVSEEMDALAEWESWRLERRKKIRLGIGPRRAGAYVFWQGNTNNTIKIGKSRDDAYKRALQHVKDNTSNGNGSPSIKTYTPLMFVCFNINNETDIHWVLALEDFLERRLQPRIKSDRLC
jgi:hypothetical protein